MPAAAAVAVVAGSAMSANASSKASKAQAASAREATELQREQYNQTREDNRGYRERGDAAGNKLQYLMGLSGGTGGGVGGSSPYKTVDQFREELLAKQGGGLTGPNDPGWQWEGVTTGADGQPIEWIRGKPHRMTMNGAEDYSYTALDELPKSQSQQADIDAQAQAMFDQQEAQRQQADAAAQNDPAYGSLMRKFTMADRDADPVYQSGLEFGLNEGTKAINNRAGAGGAFLSGATLKALTRFGNDYGSTKAGEARNRFVSDQDSQYNRLAGIAGTGQSATNQVSSAGAGYAARAGEYITQGGNASAAGTMGRGNALVSGINQGYNMYQDNQLMQQIRNPGSGWSNPNGWRDTSNSSFFYGSGGSGD